MDPALELEALGHGAALLLSLGGAYAIWGLCSVAPLPVPSTGRRARTRRGTFGFLGGSEVVDPVLRRLCRLVVPLVPESLERKLHERLEASGGLMGLDAFDLVVLSAILCVSSGIAAYWAFGFDMKVLGAMLMGTALLPGRVSARATERLLRADRELPSMIDLVAMCMDAGIDFVRALRLVSGSDRKSVAGSELEQVLSDIELGATRRQALEALVRRLPATSVKDLVAGVVQSDRTGSPLSSILATQATTARVRRSVAAEEAASRAGVLMILPLALLLGCIVLVLVGPFIVSGGL